MVAGRSVAQRLGAVLERVTRQSGRLPETPEFGSWLLGRASESQARRRVRIQVILTTFIIIANLIGVGVALLLVTVVFPVPSVFSDAPAWLTFGVAPAYIVFALIVGIIWVTRRGLKALRWAIEERAPTRDDQRNTFLAPWRLTVVQLVLWGFGTVLLTTLYGLVNPAFIPRYLFAVSFSGIVVSTSCYLFTEFALRP
ncbi:MAG: adenylate cyclase, partial [Mycobacterium sp.]|nr:adenylate cyclase [Mycobacterium sp.]